MKELINSLKNIKRKTRMIEMGSLTKEEIIEEIRKGTDIGKQIFEIELDHYKSLAKQDENNNKKPTNLVSNTKVKFFDYEKLAKARIKNQLRIHWRWLRQKEDYEDVFKFIEAWMNQVRSRLKEKRK